MKSEQIKWRFENFKPFLVIEKGKIPKKLAE
jgi:hypothetical protein